MKNYKGDLFRPIIFGVLLLTLLLGCQIVRPGKNVTKTDSTEVKLKPIDIPVKGATVTTSLNVDSLAKAYAAKYAKYILDSINAVNAGKPIPQKPKETEPKKFTDPMTKAELTYYMDQFGRLQISCQSKDQVITALTAEITRLSKQVTDTSTIIKETPKWNWIVMAVQGTLLVVSLLANFIVIKRS